MARVKVATEVLPEVPVTATTTSGCARNQSAAAPARAARGSSTTTTGTPAAARSAFAISAPAGSVSTEPAFIRSAKVTKSAPWAVDPGRAAKRWPGSTLRLSTERPVTSTSRPSRALSPRLASVLIRASVPCCRSLSPPECPKPHPPAPRRRMAPSPPIRPAPGCLAPIRLVPISLGPDPPGPGPAASNLHGLKSSRPQSFTASNFTAPVLHSPGASRPQVFTPSVLHALSSSPA